MIRAKYREVSLLSAPVFALAALAFVSAKSAAPLLVFEKAHVLTSTADTQIQVVMKYNPSLLFKRLFLKPAQRVTWTDVYLMDSKGKHYVIPNINVGVSYVENQKYQFDFYQVPLNKIPLSAGGVSLHSRLKMDDGWSSPVSVSVRPHL